MHYLKVILINFIKKAQSLCLFTSKCKHAELQTLPALLVINMHDSTSNKHKSDLIKPLYDKTTAMGFAFSEGLDIIISVLEPVFLYQGLGQVSSETSLSACKKLRSC